MQVGAGLCGFALILVLGILWTKELVKARASRAASKLQPGAHERTSAAH
jgi:hypothetical protein